MFNREGFCPGPTILAVKNTKYGELVFRPGFRFKQQQAMPANE
jgi:hypothetical protein